MNAGLRIIAGLFVAVALALGGVAHARLHDRLFVEICADDGSLRRAPAPPATVGADEPAADCALCLAPLAPPARPDLVVAPRAPARTAPPSQPSSAGRAPLLTRARDPPVGAARA
jgi:hypothetical protein